jgi:hypothetical protein
MHTMPESVQPALRRLARRLALGLFLDIWPAWAVGGLLAAALVALVCRLSVPAASPALPWLWLTPVLALLPAIIIYVRRAYRPAEVVAVADWLNGGQGTLLALLETNDASWSNSALAERASTFTLPRLRPWRRLAALPPALVFMATALWIPQRMPRETNAILAEEIAGNLTATVNELKQQQLITPEEEKTLEEEIERIRKSAEERVDASSWEAADSLRDKLAADVAGKQDAIKWAEETLARYAAAAEGGPGADDAAAAPGAELMKALEQLAKRGMLAGASDELQRLAAGGKLPANAASLRNLMASLAKHLADANGRMAGVGKLGKAAGRFDPSQFPLESGESGVDGDGNPGRGGINRGRGDAELTWGKESLPLDRFKSHALPPGAARSPDDWAPVVELPGAPRESPAASVASAARQYTAAAGQRAWRRSLAPRHQSAVKKYFDK